ncbi:hypothetical protein NQ314_020735 [Rhamnusium bicolor]|uniref:Uncharacterized protein n=1 Tax=Rhamnusium bicolor TaxID=1586634 RepID=A0AAV8WKA6_9CUCU|nr:hypothetical protein NQ314_020735 [Rhamnusium bicolor]
MKCDLDGNVAWTIICNFLMFEYYGKVDELKSIIRYDTDVKCLVDNIWYFYSGDRMFMLKTLRHIFENVSDKEHIFHEQFDSFMKSIDINFLWKNLVKMFDNLINEIDRDKVVAISSETIPRWIHRNNREQVEVVMLLIHAIQYCKLDGKELEDMLVLFIRHGFARHPLYHDSTTISKPKDLLEVKCAKSAVF